MASSDYHRRQADFLNRLAESARDPDTAAELLRLASEHSAWARGPSQQNSKPKARPKRHKAA